MNYKVIIYFLITPKCIKNNMKTLRNKTVINLNKIIIFIKHQVSTKVVQFNKNRKNHKIQIISQKVLEVINLKDFLVKILLKIIKIL